MNIDEVKKFCGSYEESDQKGIKIYDFEDVLPDCIDPVLHIDIKGNVLVINNDRGEFEHPINKIKSIELYNMADEYDDEQVCMKVRISPIPHNKKIKKGIALTKEEYLDVEAWAKGNSYHLYGIIGNEINIQHIHDDDPDTIKGMDGIAYVGNYDRFFYKNEDVAKFKHD